MNRFLQALIAISGVVISGLLGYQSLESGRRQQEATMIAIISDQISNLAQSCQRSETSVGLAAMAIEGLQPSAQATYKELLAQAIDGCAAQTEDVAAAPAPAAPAPAPAQQQQQQQQAQVALPRALERNTWANNAPVAGAAPPPPQAQMQIEQRAEIVQRNLELKSQEIGSKMAPSKEIARRWFAVLASYKVGEEEKFVVEDVARFNKMLKEGGSTSLKVGVYRTKLSNHYAIVLTPADGDADRTSARTLAGRARELGLSPDSFVQEDRDWVPCTAVATIEQVQSCK
jgi:hypothetical protein